MKTISRAALGYLLFLLLLQLFIRSHNITTLPIFTDEWSHMGRAAVIYDFDRHPAVESRGKFLFYFVPGVFDLTEPTTSLHLARTSVALTSLLTTAVVFLIGRALFDERAGLIGATVYALVPYAFFFERMALADAWAGFIAAATVWMAIRFARKPNLYTAFYIGLFMALTPAAKLTLSFIAMIPAATILLIGHYTHFQDLLKRYFRLSLIALVVTAGFWALVLVPALIENLLGTQDYIIYDNHLVEVATESDPYGGKLNEWWVKQELLMSVPLTLLWAVVVPIALWKMPRRYGVLVAWLALAWFATFFIVRPGSFQSRYLMAGLPAVATLLGNGLIITIDTVLFALGGGRVRQYALSVAGGVIGIWALLFVLPFAQTLVSTPADLTLPEQDEKDYFGGWFNAYALDDATLYVQSLGEAEGDTLYTVSHARFCLPDVYRLDALDLHCQGTLFADEPDNSLWQEAIVEPLQDREAVYLISEIYGLKPDENPYQWERLADYRKPQQHPELGYTLSYTVWRITAPEQAATTTND
jgi:hypothetical protein